MPIPILLPPHTQRKGKKKGVKKEIKLLMHLFFLGKQANHELCVCVTRFIFTRLSLNNVC